MNILYTIFSFTVGGAEKLTVDIINNWDFTKGDKLYLCIINDDYDQELLKMVQQNKNINILLLKRPKGGSRLNYIYQYYRFIKEKQIKIIHCQCINSIIFSLWPKLLLKKIKLFHTVHDTTIYQNLNIVKVWIDRIFTHKIIAISDCVRKEVLDRGVEEAKVCTVYNGIDVEKYVLPKKNHQGINIVCVARIVPEKKGQHILISALKVVKRKYPNIKCYFAGAPAVKQSNELDKLKELVTSLGLDENVIFLGNVSNIPYLLSNMDIFVLPSRYEGFGLVVVEAMAAKLSVIASNLQGPKELLRDGKYGKLFESQNEFDLAEKIISLIEMEDRQIEVDKAYQYVVENFNINKMISNLREVYEM